MEIQGESEWILNSFCLDGIIYFYYYYYCFLQFCSFLELHNFNYLSVFTFSLVKAIRQPSPPEDNVCACMLIYATSAFI